MRLLERLKDCSLANLRDHGSCRANFKKITFEIVGCVTAPNLKHHINRFNKHIETIFPEVTENFSVRHQSARADTHDESTLQQMIDH